MGREVWRTWPMPPAQGARKGWERKNCAIIEQLNRRMRSGIAETRPKLLRAGFLRLNDACQQEPQNPCALILILAPLARIVKAIDV